MALQNGLFYKPPSVHNFYCRSWNFSRKCRKKGKYSSCPALSARGFCKLWVMTANLNDYPSDNEGITHTTFFFLCVSRKQRNLPFAICRKRMNSCWFYTVIAWKPERRGESNKLRYPRNGCPVPTENVCIFPVAL